MTNSQASTLKLCLGYARRGRAAVPVLAYHATARLEVSQEDKFAS